MKKKSLDGSPESLAASLEETRELRSRLVTDQQNVNSAIDAGQVYVHMVNKQNDKDPNAKLVQQQCEQLQYRWVN